MFGFPIEDVAQVLELKRELMDGLKLVSFGQAL